MQNNGNPDPQEFRMGRIMTPRNVTREGDGSFLERQYQNLTNGRGGGGQPAAHTPNQAQVGVGGAGGDQPTAQAQDGGAGDGQPTAQAQDGGAGDGRNVRQRTDEVQASNQAQVGDGGAGFGRAGGAGGDQRPMTPRLDIYDFPPAALRQNGTPPPANQALNPPQTQTACLPSDPAS